jgi:hypothetical protein
MSITPRPSAQPTRMTLPHARGRWRRRALGAAIAATTLSAVLACSSQARTYYVSPSGNDNNSGTSTSAPWRSITKVNKVSYSPGDFIAFQGGGTYWGTIMPYSSGTSSAPIVFGSYGSGKANVPEGVWLKSVSYLTFQDLVVAGADRAFTTSPSGSGARNMQFLRNETYDNTKGYSAGNTADANWLIRDCKISRTYDSGIHSWASDLTIQNCTISKTGQGYGSLGFHTHAIYSDGARLRALGNDISANADPDGQAISTRYRDALIEGNYIHDTNEGVGYFRDDTGSGTTILRRNKFYNIRLWPLYIGPGNRASGIGENFQVYNNTVVNPSAVGGAAFNWSSTGGKTFTFKNNAVQGFGSAVRYTSGVDQSNNIVGNLGLNGWTPASGSRLINAGTSHITSGVDLSKACNGTAVAYCGSAPDVGAVEAG